MVGGGRTGQVGYKHRTGALRDNTSYKLVCGAFDLDAERGRDFGSKLGVDEERLYADYKSMIAAFEFATTITGDPSYQATAILIAKGRGWSVT